MDLNYVKIHLITCNLYYFKNLLYRSRTEKSKHSNSPFSLEQFSYKIVLNSYFRAFACALSPPFSKGSTAKRQCKNWHLLTDCFLLHLVKIRGRQRLETEYPKMENVNLMFTSPNLQGLCSFPWL